MAAVRRLSARAVSLDYETR